MKPNVILHIYDHYLECNDTILNNANHNHTLAFSFV